MSVKLLSEGMGATITDLDQARIDAILSFWFQQQTLNAPHIDGRMDIWFGTSTAFDAEISEKFIEDVDAASSGQLAHWARNSRGLLALILLLDQFRRNIYRHTDKALEMDKTALKLCVEGAMKKLDRDLTPIERVFFYMPLQHAESRKVQRKSVKLYDQLATAVSPTYKETFQTIAQFAELHADIIEQFGRFPHRNKLLGRKNTAEEEEYLAADSPDFGQS